MAASNPPQRHIDAKVEIESDQDQEKKELSDIVRQKIPDIAVEKLEQILEDEDIIINAKNNRFDAIKDILEDDPIKLSRGKSAKIATGLCESVLFRSKGLGLGGFGQAVAFAQSGILTLQNMETVIRNWVKNNSNAFNKLTIVFREPIDRIVNPPKSDLCTIDKFGRYDGGCRKKETFRFIELVQRLSLLDPGKSSDDQILQQFQNISSKNDGKKANQLQDEEDMKNLKILITQLNANFNLNSSRASIIGCYGGSGFGKSDFLDHLVKIFAKHEWYCIPITLNDSTIYNRDLSEETNLIYRILFKYYVEVVVDEKFEKLKQGNKILERTDEILRMTLELDYNNKISVIYDEFCNYMTRFFRFIDFSLFKLLIKVKSEILQPENLPNANQYSQQKRESLSPSGTFRLVILIVDEINKLSNTNKIDVLLSQISKFSDFKSCVTIFSTTRSKEPNEFATSSGRFIEWIQLHPINILNQFQKVIRAKGFHLLASLIGPHPRSLYWLYRWYCCDEHFRKSLENNNLYEAFNIFYTIWQDVATLKTLRDYVKKPWFIDVVCNVLLKNKIKSNQILHKSNGENTTYHEIMSYSVVMLESKHIINEEEKKNNDNQQPEQQKEDENKHEYGKQIEEDEIFYGPISMSPLIMYDWSVKCSPNHISKSITKLFSSLKDFASLRAERIIMYLLCLRLNVLLKEQKKPKTYINLDKVFSFTEQSSSCKGVKLLFNKQVPFATTYVSDVEFKDYEKIIEPGEILSFKRINEGSDIVICFSCKEEGKVLLMIEIKWIELNVYETIFTQLMNSDAPLSTNIIDRIVKEIVKNSGKFDASSLFEQEKKTQSCFQSYKLASKDKDVNDYVYYVCTIKECELLDLETIKYGKQCLGIMFSQGLQQFEQLCGALANFVKLCWISSLSNDYPTASS